MDLWVVAAATGAGYLAKYLRNSYGEKEELSESSSQLRDQTSPFCRITRKNVSKYGDLFWRKDEDVANGNYEVSDILTLNSLEENVVEKSGNMDYFKNGGEVLHELETNRSTRRTREFSTKSIIPLETCYAKLNKEKIMKKGYLFSPLPSPSTPFAVPLVSNRTVNLNSRDLFVEFVNGDDDMLSLGEKNEILGSHLSRKWDLVELPRSQKHKVGKDQTNIAGSSETLLSQGPLNGMVLFYAGITIGILSSVIANKRKLDEMNEQLKHKDNLARDLHEEIEMRDNINVKEIFKEDKKSLNSNSSLLPENDLDDSKNHVSEEADDQNLDKLELMSKIEAELEAELEKLDLNISSSGVQRESDFVELDPDSEAEVGTLTNHTSYSNYVVSPWELSMRLHEVIESRLKARIEELEQALRKNRNRYSIDLLRIISTNESENGEIGYSKIQKCIYDVDDMDPPLLNGGTGNS